MKKQKYPPSMQDDYSALERFLGDASRPDGTFTFHELQGFLFAIASSPDTIPPSEWMPMIGNDESLTFADEREAEKILGLVMSLYNEVNLAVLERRNALCPCGSGRKYKKCCGRHLH